MKPCIVHANGWDKGPLLRLLLDSGRLPEADYNAFMEKKMTLDKQNVSHYPSIAKWY